jgi:cytochrome c-type biogenesis protein CcmH
VTNVILNAWQLRAKAAVSALIFALTVHSPVKAVEPSEILENPVLESRARELSKGLRCLVCRNQSIDDSDASLAKDLRVVVRERLVAGDTDGEVLDFVVDRYGEYVLLKPRFSIGNAALYLGGPLLLIIGGFSFWRMTRKPAEAVATARGPAPLTEEEKRKLDALIGKDA